MHAVILDIVDLSEQEYVEPEKNSGPGQVPFSPSRLFFARSQQCCEVVCCIHLFQCMMHFQHGADFPHSIVLSLFRQRKKVGDFASAIHEDHKPLSRAQFLNRLPKTVIRDGCIIKLREETERFLDGKKVGCESGSVFV